MTLTKKYNLYKESNIPWLTEVPIDWEITALKRYYKIQLGKMLQPQPSSFNDVEVDYLKAIHVQWGNVQLVNIPKMWATQLDLEKYNVKNGDLLICEGGEVGRSAILSGLKGECIIQNAIHRVEQTAKGLNKYLYYFMKHVANAGWFDILCNKATIAHLTSEKLSAIQMCCPSIIEQQKIADFLDYKTAQIDALIAKKETLLLKLQEKRSALITQAVTKGINPNVPMKPSGVEWLGDVPAHWEVKRMRFGLTTNPSKNELDLEEDDLVSFIPMEAVGEYGGLVLETEKEVSEIGSGYTYFKDDDVVVAKITPCFENGKGAIAKGLKNKTAFGTTELHVLRASAGLNPDFLFQLTISYPFRKIGESEMYGAGGQKRVPETFIKDFKIGFPPLAEQLQIVEYIKQKNDYFERQFKAVSDAITRLSEYRSALITNAVTGKIDVRDFVVPSMPS